MYQSFFYFEKLDFLKINFWFSQVGLFLFCFQFCFLRWSLTLSPDWSAVAQSRLTATSASRFKQFFCLSLPSIAGTPGTQHQAHKSLVGHKK